MTLSKTFVSAFLLLPFASPLFAAEPSVVVLKTPDEGIQPQAVVDRQGNIHLIVFKGAPSAGDIEYLVWKKGEKSFSKPIRVNSRDGSAMAIGTIRGAQVCLGRDGRIHVAWNGSGATEPNKNGGVGFFYARSNADGTAFEPERDLMTRSSGLDGGGSIAADDSGRVFAFWHGRTKKDAVGERGRRLYVARSVDDGATFAPEIAVLPDQETGACGCCGMKALAAGDGKVFAVYRAAREGVDRDLTLVESTDGGETFKGSILHPWPITTCPMSSMSFTKGGDGAIMTAWETEGQVYFQRLDDRSTREPRPISPPGARGGRKHPSIARNAKGETLLAWTEGTGWQKGGALVWLVFDAQGRPTKRQGRIDRGIPVWGLPTVVARQDDGFAIIH